MLVPQVELTPKTAIQSPEALIMLFPTFENIVGGLVFQAKRVTPAQSHLVAAASHNNGMQPRCVYMKDFPAT